MISGPVAQAGQCLLFLFRMLAGIRFSGSQILAVLQQIYLIGARSLVIIMICGFFVGMVLSLQSINALEQFGASDQVSLLVVKSLFLELGPVGIYNRCMAHRLAPQIRNSCSSL